MVADGVAVGGELSTEGTDRAEEPAGAGEWRRVVAVRRRRSGERGMLGEQGLLGDGESAVEQRESSELRSCHEKLRRECTEARSSGFHGIPSSAR